MNDKLIIDITTLTEAEKTSGVKCINFDWEDLIEHKELIPFDVVLDYLYDHLLELNVEEIDSASKWIETFKKEMKKHIIK